MVRIRPLVAAPGLKTPDLGVFTDIRLMDRFDDTPYTSFFPNPLMSTEGQALEALDQYSLHVYDIDAVGASAAALLVPGSRFLPLGSLKKGLMSTCLIVPPET